MKLKGVPNFLDPKESFETEGWKQLWTKLVIYKVYSRAALECYLSKNENKCLWIRVLTIYSCWELTNEKTKRWRNLNRGNKG